MWHRTLHLTLYHFVSTTPAIEPGQTQFHLHPFEPLVFTRLHGHSCTLSCVFHWPVCLPLPLETHTNLNNNIGCVAYLRDWSPSATVSTMCAVDCARKDSISSAWATLNTPAPTATLPERLTVAHLAGSHPSSSRRKNSMAVNSGSATCNDSNTGFDPPNRVRIAEWTPLSPPRHTHTSPPNSTKTHTGAGPIEPRTFGQRTLF